MGTTPLADLLQLPGAAALVAVDLISTPPAECERDWDDTPTPGAGWLQPHHSHAGRDPSRGDRPTGGPKPNLARSPGSRHHRSVASSPSAAFLRLRAFIAERMRMSLIDQPRML